MTWVEFADKHVEALLVTAVIISIAIAWSKKRGL